MTNVILLVLCTAFAINMEPIKQETTVSQEIRIETIYNDEFLKQASEFKEDLLEDYVKYSKLFEPKEMRITCYTSKPHELNAVGKKPVVGKSCAVSRDHRELLGKKVYIEGEGIFVIDDLCNARIKNTLDIYRGGPETRQDCLQFGAQKKEVSVLMD